MLKLISARRVFLNELKFKRNINLSKISLESSSKLFDRFVLHIKSSENSSHQLMAAELKKYFLESNSSNELKQVLKKKSDSSPKELFEMLQVLLETLPAQIVNLDFYQEAIRKLVVHYKSEKMTKDEFIKLIFLISLMKNKNRLSRVYLSELISNHLNSTISEMSSMDFAIFCNSLYKTSFKLSLLNFRNRLISEIEKVDNDIPFLVTLVKSFRQNKFKSKEVHLKLKELMRSGKLENLDFRATVHLFTLLAESRKKDDELINVFVKNASELLNDPQADTNRMKDWAKFLFCCSHLNAKIDETCLQKLEILVERKLLTQSYKNFDHIVDSVLSLSTFGSQRLIDTILNHKEFRFTNNFDRSKIESRMKMLQTVSKISRNQVPFEESPKFLIRDSLKRIVRILEEHKLENVKILQMEHLWIAGILLNDSIHIEVLDDSNCLSNRTPTGIFKLKIKLLKHMGRNVLLVSILHL